VLASYVIRQHRQQMRAEPQIKNVNITQFYCKKYRFSLDFFKNVVSVFANFFPLIDSSGIPRWRAMSSDDTGSRCVQNLEALLAGLGDGGRERDLRLMGFSKGAVVITGKKN
jgi:hypothetical protein